MPTTVQLRTRLLKKLKELFQLDQPDLDFGFYKIMHAKSEQVERFIDDDLLRIVEEAFADSVADKAESEVDAAKRKLIEAMGEEVFDADGVISEDAAKYPAGKAYTEALQKAGSQVSSLTEEGQVYDHLFRFFERYYDNGDFVSRRYYTRETDDRAAPFAVPYNGEEVKLHWANADQYYIKTAEYFNNFTFDLSQAAEFRAMNALERTAAGVPDEAVKVHFKIVDASEGEHGNVKTKDDDKRADHFRRERRTRRAFRIPRRPEERQQAGRLLARLPQYRGRRCHPQGLAGDQRGQPNCRRLPTTFPGTCAD